MDEKRTGKDIERQGAILGGGGVLIALIGLGSGDPFAVPALVIGVAIGLVGLVMWGAGLTRGNR